jgi:hypothetical protein
MGLTHCRSTRSPEREWDLINRLLRHHRLKLNFMVPTHLYPGPTEVRIQSLADHLITGNGELVYVLASTYYPEAGELQIAFSGKRVNCRDGLRQAILKTVDFIDWVEDIHDESGRHRYTASSRRTKERFMHKFGEVLPPDHYQE